MATYTFIPSSVTRVGDEFEGDGGILGDNPWGDTSDSTFTIDVRRIPDEEHTSDPPAITMSYSDPMDLPVGRLNTLKIITRYSCLVLDEAGDSLPLESATPQFFAGIVQGLEVPDATLGWPPQTTGGYTLVSSLVTGVGDGVVRDYEQSIDFTGPEYESYPDQVFIDFFASLNGLRTFILPDFAVVDMVQGPDTPDDTHYNRITVYEMRVEFEYDPLTNIEGSLGVARRAFAWQ